MYLYILCFQTACIIVSGICLYLAVTDEKLRKKKYGVPLIAVLVGICLAEIGYGLYLQEITMGGLQAAEKFCLMGKLGAVVGFFVTCVSLSDKDSTAVKMAAGILGLTCVSFLLFDSLHGFLYTEQNFLQNQFRSFPCHKTPYFINFTMQFRFTNSDISSDIVYNKTSLPKKTAGKGGIHAWKNMMRRFPLRKTN